MLTPRYIPRELPDGGWAPYDTRQDKFVFGIRYTSEANAQDGADVLNKHYGALLKDKETVRALVR